MFHVERPHHVFPDLPLAAEPSLAQALHQLGLPADAWTVAALLRYSDLLLEWSDRVRLVSRADRTRIYPRHLLDSLVGAAFLPASPAVLLDIGTGAGLPGLPLQLVRPDLQVILVESARMKVLFLRHVADVLGLGSLRVLHERAEAVAAREGPVADVVTARAVAALPRLWELSEPLLREGGCLLAWKGPGEGEATGLPEGLAVEENRVRIPVWDRERAIVRVRRR